MTNPNDHIERLMDILVEVYEALADCAQPVGLPTIEVGEPAWSRCTGNCADGGHLYGRYVIIGKGQAFPRLVVAENNCSMMTFAQVEIGVLRCQPKPQGKEVAISASAQNAAAGLVLRDAAVVHQVLDAMDDVGPHSYAPAFEDWQPLPSQGGCWGGRTRAWIDVSLCDCAGPNPGGSS